MKQKTYTLTFCLSALSILIPVFLVNFICDPGEIYFQKWVKAKYVEDYTNALLSSPNGVREFANERMVKASIAKKAGDYDTVIFGSSRAMTLGPIRMPNFRKSFPGPVINLSASAWTFEDTLIFSHMILHNPRMPRNIIIDIDPWSLRWNVSDRYAIFQDYLGPMLDDMGVKAEKVKREPYFIKLLKNAFSLEYFSRSIKLLASGNFKWKPENVLKDYGEVGPFDFDEGAEHTVTLQDGSRVFSKEGIWSLKGTLDRREYGYLGSDGEYYDENVVRVLEALTGRLRERGAEVYFFMPPFNPLVYGDESALSWDRFTAVENRIRDMARRNNIKVFGSYDPKANNLDKDQFYDFQHVKPQGLDQIDYSH